jgi:hypothetical protein
MDDNIIFKKYMPIGNINSVSDMLEYEIIRLNEICNILSYLDKLKKQHKKNIESTDNETIINFENKRIAEINLLLVKFDNLKMQHKQNIEEFKQKKEMVISDHCFLRYLKRVKNIDFNKLSEEIADKNILKAYETLGDGVYYKDGYGYLIKNYHMVTVLYDKQERNNNGKIKYRKSPV